MPVLEAAQSVNTPVQNSQEPLVQTDTIQDSEQTSSEHLSLQFKTDPQSILALQRSIGNRAVVQLLEQRNNVAAEDTHSHKIHQVAEQGVQGSSSKLPHFESIQKSFGRYDVSAVQAYTSSKAASASEAIGAKAYTIGKSVAFASSSPDLHTTAHEATHTIQQSAGVQLKGGVGEAGDQYERHADAVADKVVQGQSAESLLNTFAAHTDVKPPPQTDKTENPLLTGVQRAQYASHSRFLASKNVVQKLDSQLDGPPRDKLPAGAPDNTNYGGHAVNLPGGGALTNGCDGAANIVTAGENLANVKSDPATPNHMDDYTTSKKWSRAGGLLHDPSINKDQAATKMHALNHHLDHQALNDPVKENIFLGTKVSNNPRHLNLVETPVLNSIGDNNYNRHPGNPTDYQKEIARAVIKKTKLLPGGQTVLYWPGDQPGVGGGNAKIDDNAVKHNQLKRVAADNMHYNKGVILHPAGGAPGGYNEIGQALEINEDTANNNYWHAWVDYTITPNYHGIPDYIMANIQHETGQLAIVDGDLAGVLAAQAAELGNFLQALTLPTPVADVALILGEAAAVNAATAAAIVQAMGHVAAATVVQLLPFATTNIIIGALANPHDVNLYDALPAAYKRGFVAAGHAAPAGAAAVAAGAAGADPNLPPAGAANAVGNADAARILQIMQANSIDAAAAVFMQYPVGNARQILQAAGALNPLLAHIPADHAADIINAINNVGGAGLNAAAAEAILNGLGASKAGRILRFLPINNALPIIQAARGIGAARAGGILQNLTPDYAVNMIDAIRGVNAGHAAGIFQTMTPINVAAITELLPLANARAILAALPAAFNSQVLARLPADHAAQRIADIAANVAGGALLAGQTLQAIDATIIRRNIFAQLTANSAGAMLAALGAGAVVSILAELPNNLVVDIIDSIANANAATAVAILQASPAQIAAGIIVLLPLATTRAILTAYPDDNTRAQLLTDVVNHQIAYAAHGVHHYLNNGATAAMLAIIQAMAANDQLLLYNELTAAERGTLVGAGLGAPAAAAAAPGNLPALAVANRPPAVAAAGNPAVAPGGLPGGMPGGVPNVAPAAVPAAIAPNAALPGTSILGGGAGDLAGIITNVLGQIPAADVRRALSTLSAADAATIAGAMPNGTKAEKALNYKLEKLGSFPAWAREVCPTNFTAEVKYYTASYNPANIYDLFKEKETYRTDAE